MLGIGGLLFGLFAIGSGINCAIDNAQSKRESAYYDQNGNLTCYDRKGREYKNGERVTQHVRYDNGHNRYTYSVEVNSGKIYNSVDTDRNLYYRRVSDENALKYAKEYNKKTACIWNDYFGRNVTTELETGKVIACLWTQDDRFLKPGEKKEYRKWYVKPNAKPWEYNTTDENDFGILITKEEYVALNCALGSHAKIPTYNVLKKLSSPKTESEGHYE